MFFVLIRWLEPVSGVKTTALSVSSLFKLATPPGIFKSPKHTPQGNLVSTIGGFNGFDGFRTASTFLGDT